MSDPDHTDLQKWRWVPIDQADRETEYTFYFPPLHRANSHHGKMIKVCKLRECYFRQPTHFLEHPPDPKPITEEPS